MKTTNKKREKRNLVAMMCSVKKLKVGGIEMLGGSLRLKLQIYDAETEGQSDL